MECVIKHDFLKFTLFNYRSFNYVLSMDEYEGGPHSYYSCKAGKIAEFMYSNNLLDVDFIGVDFTWCNNQLGLARRWDPLDRCLVNSLWSTNFDCCILKHLPHIFSDHAPILLSASPYNYLKSKIFVLTTTS